MKFANDFKLLESVRVNHSFVSVHYRRTFEPIQDGVNQRQQAVFADGSAGIATGHRFSPR
jgi:hypothetical protein